MKRWQSGKSGDAWELCLIKTVRSDFFSPADGITKEMISDFKDTFAGSYVGSFERAYPDIRTTDIREISGEMAGLGMTMTDSTELPDEPAPLSGIGRGRRVSYYGNLPGGR